MAGNFLAGDFLAYAVTFGDFMAGNFWILYHLTHIVTYNVVSEYFLPVFLRTIKLENVRTIIKYI